MEKKTIKEIKEAIPDINSEKVDVLADELDRILSIKRIFQSADGKELIKLLRGNCQVALNKLIIQAKEDPKLDILVSLIHSYSANVDLLSLIQDIKTEEEIRLQLDEAVKEVINLK